MQKIAETLSFFLELLSFFLSFEFFSKCPISKPVLLTVSLRNFGEKHVLFANRALQCEANLLSKFCKCNLLSSCCIVIWKLHFGSALKIDLLKMWPSQCLVWKGRTTFWFCCHFFPMDPELDSSKFWSQFSTPYST